LGYVTASLGLQFPVFQISVVVSTSRLKSQRPLKFRQLLVSKHEEQTPSDVELIPRKKDMSSILVWKT